MDLESKARKFLSEFGLANQLDRFMEECNELIESIRFGDTDERIAELSDVRNILGQLEVYVADRANMSTKMLDSLIVHSRVQKNKRTEERIASGFYNDKVQPRHRYLDIGHLSQGDQEKIMNMIQTCGRGKR